ncbi:unnamed protein product [Ranitomeya imitator]|uniref:Uncharacterized protein n=1 Tax=Ranitomeya imitator TaxID=111125 RepID=A0ABN9MR13_9NEOB|nr:unnamed protein product [Ranitomeya imitator]
MESAKRKVLDCNDGEGKCMKDSQQSVTVVIFQDEHTIISAGAVDGIIKLWDLRKNYTTYRQDPIPAKSLPYPGSSSRKLGYSSLILDSTGTNLFASCTDDNIYMFNVAGLKSDPDLSPTPNQPANELAGALSPVTFPAFLLMPVMDSSVFSGHHNSTFYTKSSLSPDGQFLLSGSSDHSAYIWQYTPAQGKIALCRHLLRRTENELQSNIAASGRCVFIFGTDR